MKRLQKTDGTLKETLERASGTIERNAEVFLRLS